MNFAFRSYDVDGRVRTGNIEASSKDEALYNLTEQKLTVIELREGRENWWTRLNEPRGNEYSVNRRDLQRFLSDFAQLLHANIRAENALRIASELAEKPSVKKLALTLLGDLRKGSTLADACIKYPNVFPPHVTAALSAGERGGQLHQTLSRLTEAEAQILNFREKLTSSLIYPSILLVTVSITFAVIIFVVLPGFAPLFDLNDERVPLVTRLVMRFGQHAGTIGTVVAMAAAGVGALFAYILGNQYTRRRFDRWLMHRGFGRDWLVAPDLIRCSQILGSSLQAGVKIDAALRLAADSARNTHLHTILHEGVQEVRRGRPLAEFWEKEPAIPPVLVHFLRIGEQTGDTGTMCMAAAQQLTQGYQRRLDRLLALFPPLITLALGGLAAILVSAVLLGMISLNNVAL